MIEMHPRVVHFKKQLYDVYIGRPGPFGNPFPLQSEGERLVCIEQFEKWFLSDDSKAVEMRARALRELPGKILGCWCRPRICHGDVIARYVDENSGA